MSECENRACVCITRAVSFPVGISVGGKKEKNWMTLRLEGRGVSEDEEEVGGAADAVANQGVARFFRGLGGSEA